ncbi:MAG: ABC transporter ATP-binding protein [Ruminococcus sp.]|nr:ABC transporter ATP-binding protein [Ruminococcus sp.]
MQDNAAISAENISVGYGKITVAGNITFSLNSGEILTLIGPNGAGKSTILKSIAAQLHLVSGSVYIDKREISSMKERELSRKLSLVLTERIHAERMTCEDVVATGRYPYTGRLGLLSSEDIRIIDEAMELTGISYLKDSDIKEISDGQRQCVMLARAIAQQPKVMLLDEPTSFLDVNNKLELLSLLRKLVKEKHIAVIQSIHELDLAQRFSDKILCIKNRKADRIGTSDEIFSGDYIDRLYGISSGSFMNLYGTAEPAAVSGEPKIFVIGGGGSGVFIYHKLWRKNIPFAAGIIHKNDIEFPIAKALASVLIDENAFEAVSDKTVQKALKIMGKCSKIICCPEQFGTMNAGCIDLLKEAQKCGKLVNVEDI